MTVLWVLIPGPFVGYWIVDSVRKIFSEDETLLKRLFKEQPVTALAATTMIGSVAVWVVSVAAINLWRAL